MHEGEQSPLTRRYLLGYAVATLGIPALAREGYTLYEEHKQHFYENFPEVSATTFPEEEPVTQDPIADSLDTLKNPFFRSSTVSFLNGQIIYAHGSLVKVNDKICIYTIGHVADVARDIPTTIGIPGVGKTSLIPERMLNTVPSQPNEEPSAYYVFSEQNQEHLRLQEESGTLRIFSRLFEAPQQGERVAVPRYDKGFLRYAFDSYLREQNYFTFHGSDPLPTQNCKGDSGSPILRLRTDSLGQEYLTGEVYGVLEGVYGEEVITDPLTGRDCAKTKIFARPNN